jgi:epoxyqueuosine reductase QueG
MIIMNEMVLEFLADLFSKNELNRLPKSYTGDRIFSNPLIGVAKGDDPIFKKYKEIISSKHLTPNEMWNAAGLQYVKDSNLRILSIACPFSNQIRAESMKARIMPAEIYSIGRNYANEFKIDIMKNTIKLFQKEGFDATAGMLSNDFNIYPGFFSSWSERHIAFAAGLGTFSLHEGLISEVGCNIRLCSVITNAPLQVTPRKSDDPYTNCLYYINGTCRECEKKCPANAINENGHDKKKCRIYGRKIEAEMKKRLGPILKPYLRRISGKMVKSYPVGCAFCQFGVPCMDSNPLANIK